MLYSAAAIFVILGLAHSWLGERYILTRLFRRGELPRLLGGTDFTKNTLRYAWHLNTVLAFRMAAVLVQAAGGGAGPALTATIGWTSLACGIMAVIITRGKHLSWIGLLAAGGACLWWAAR